MIPWPIQMIRLRPQMLVFPFEANVESNESNESNVESIELISMSCTEIPYNSKVAKATKAPKPRKPRAKKVETYLPLAIERGDCWISVQLPLRTVSEANTYCHWSERAKRKSQQRSLIFATLNPIRNEIKLPCTITLKRYGPKLLDGFDNLPSSFKACVDACAEVITGKGRGRGDDDPRLTWKAEQEVSSSYGIKIIFEF